MRGRNVRHRDQYPFASIKSSEKLTLDWRGMLGKRSGYVWEVWIRILTQVLFSVQSRSQSFMFSYVRLELRWIQNQCKSLIIKSLMKQHDKGYCRCEDKANALILQGLNQVARLLTAYFISALLRSSSPFSLAFCKSLEASSNRCLRCRASSPD